MQKNLSHIPKIRVIIRKRPLSKKQFGRGQKDIIEIPNNQTVLVKQEKVKLDLTPYLDQYKFIFDGAFNQNANNQKIYKSIVSPLIDAAFDGAKVSCFAYGQTGSGKTFTMLGDGKNIKGLYLLAAQDVFNIQKDFNDISVWVSFYQIYCGKLYDLLNQRTLLHARQDAKNNINIVGLSQRKTQNLAQFMQTIQFGTSIRVTAQNSTNMDSSRSHAILQITLRKNKKIHGKISFIDLAGSQRAADHADQTDKQTRIDGAEINKSLLALKQCIRALDQNKNHTPFRGSKLTMVLKDSFVGYCKTVMIANISPNSSSCQNTLNTLKYADRVKQLKRSSNRQKLPDDYLNDLSRELMLPRQMVHHHVTKDQKPKHSDSQQTLIKNNYVNNEIQIDSDMKRQIKRQKQPKVQSNKIKQNQVQKQGHQRRAHSVNPSNNDLNKMSYESQQQIYERLNQRHEQMLQKVIQGQETLITEHEIYINKSVQSTKQHIQIMNNADKVGSTIDNYLTRLDNTLQKEMEEIYRIKALIENLKYNLDQSKKVQNLYMQINNRSHFNQNHRGQQNESYFNGNYQGHQQRNNFNSIGNLGQMSNIGGLNFNYNNYERDGDNQIGNGQIDYDNDEQLLFD